MTCIIHNAGDLFRSHGDSGRIALTDASGHSMRCQRTYRELDDACNAVARGIIGAGCVPGNCIGILSLNRCEFVEVFFGAMRAGCTPVPINVSLPDNQINTILADADVKMVFADRKNADRSLSVPDVIGFDDPGEGGYQQFLDTGPFVSEVPEINSVALLPYTSGSTGLPKGVMLSHSGVIWINRTVAKARNLSPLDRSLIAAPLFHKNGLNTLKQTLISGGEAVIMERFDAKNYLRALIEHRCTLLGGVPTMFVRVLNEKEILDEAEFSFVTRIGFGSAPAADTLIEELRTIFPAAVIENNYGITEGGPVIFGPHPEGRPRPDNSVGYPLPDVEVQFEAGSKSNKGILHVRSPGVMMGYLNQPEATASRLNDGWFNTGDIFWRDEYGFYTFAGRDDDMFVCGGENIHPGDVSALLEQHPAILQAAVVPLADNIKGEVPFAFVVRRPGVDVSVDDIKQFALSKGPAYAHPRKIVFIDKMPLTGNAKIDMAALKAQVSDALVGPQE